MCGGGGYKAPPDNSLELQREQQAYDDRIRSETQAREAEQLAQRRSGFTSALDAAGTAAQNRANATLQARGLDPNAFGDTISRSIADQRAMVPDLDANPASYFSSDFVDNILNTEQNNRRTGYVNQVNSLFPVNDDFARFGDTADDDAITGLLTTQRDAARRSVDMARNRGNLNQTGYDAALQSLEEMFNAGNAQAQSVGSGILSGYRGQLKGIADDARNTAGSYTLGSTFDPTSYQQRYNSTADDLSGRLSGDISAALGGESFFDLGDIITRGGNAQGATNPRTALTDVLAERERQRNTERGVGGGSTGVF